MPLPTVYGDTFILGADPLADDVSILLASPNGGLMSVVVASTRSVTPEVSFRLTWVDTWDAVTIGSANLALDGSDFELFGGVTRLSDGRLVAVWHGTSDSEYHQRAYYQIFDQTGAALGGRHEVAAGSAGVVRPIDVSALADGGFVLTWGEYNAPTVTNSWDVVGQTFSARGVATSAAFNMTTNSGGDQGGPEVLGLADGRFIAVWADQSGRYAFDRDQVVVARIFSATGTPESGIIVVSQSGYSNHSYQVTELTGGRFVVSWTKWDSEISAEPALMNRIFEADGSAVTDEFAVSPMPSSMQHNSVLAALQDNHYLLVWTEYETSDPYATQQSMVAQVLDADGVATDPIFLPIPDDAFSPVAPSVATLADGRVAISWSSGSYLSDSDGWILDPRAAAINATGTSGADSLVGTAFGDSIFGGSGADALAGLGGNDLIAGGVGADAILAGDGADIVHGGGSNDRIHGGDTSADLADRLFGDGGDDYVDSGSGRDRDFGGAGNDTIEGGSGDDTILGEDGRDVLSGAEDSDLLLGGAGGDFLNGGIGRDRLNGGAGADSFYHRGIGSHRTDWIQDFADADGDRLVFGAVASQSDFVVSFAEIANTGQAGVREAFVVYRPTGQILWTLVDGQAQGHIDLQIGHQTFDLLT